MKRRNLVLLIGPSIFVLFTVTIYPFFYGIYLSLTDASIKRVNNFVYFSNYFELLKDTRFLNSLLLTLLFVAGVVILQLVLGFVLAQVLNNDMRITKVARVILTIPMMMTPIVVGITWRLLLDTDYGMVNYLLSLIGISHIPWFSSPSMSLISLILVDTWQWTPFMMLILLAGLRSLPIEPYEAASLDGANLLQSLRYITLPLLSPIMIIAIIMRSIDAFKGFDIFFATTQGGPGTSSEILSLLSYKTGFRYQHMGYASAMIIVMLVVVIIISKIFIGFMNQNKEVNPER